MINVTEQNGLERPICHFLESIPQESDELKISVSKRRICQIPSSTLSKKQSSSFKNKHTTTKIRQYCILPKQKDIE
tara:strand:- start:242 stop:469 length:228 start_codon:yes stop_codon:yes gene_type:complete